MAEYIKKQALIKALEADFNTDWNGYSKVFQNVNYVNGVRDEYDDVLKIICGMETINIQEFDFMSKDFLYWLSNDYYRLFCERYECNSCPFSINNNGFEMRCTELNDKQILQIIKQMYDKNKNTSFLRG